MIDRDIKSLAQLGIRIDISLTRPPIVLRLHVARSRHISHVELSRSARAARSICMEFKWGACGGDFGGSEPKRAAEPAREEAVGPV
jgi:hypothetical protein